MLSKTPLLHQSLGPHVFLSLCVCVCVSLSLRLILWSTEAHWAHSPAWASKTLSRRRSVPSPPQQGAWCLCEQCKPHTRGFIGFLCKPRNSSLFLSPLLSYHRLRTTRFRSIKGPQHIRSTGSQPLDQPGNPHVPYSCQCDDWGERGGPWATT